MTIINRLETEQEFLDYKEHFKMISDYLYWRAMMVRYANDDHSLMCTERAADILNALPMWAKTLLEFTNV